MGELNQDQIFAFFEANKWKVNGFTDQIFEISGAAGTGKTYSAKYILSELGYDIMREVLWVAYTGKAATQLARNGLPAITCHSAFYEPKIIPVYDDNGNPVYKANGKRKTKIEFRKKEYLKKRYKIIAIDEATMVNEDMKNDILSFGLPILALGDMNQLPPVFGAPAFMQHPNVELRQLMRQAENDPIIYIAHMILDGKYLRRGVYGKSAIIGKKDLTEFQLKSADIILTGTNRLRGEINNLFRNTYYNYPKPEFPYVGEKVICRKNNWSKSIANGIYLTNGITGFLEYVSRESYNGRKILVDFRPDFCNVGFHNLNIDYKHLMQKESSPNDSLFKYDLDVFEFAYAITIYSSQGSQWENVVSLAELYGSDDFQRSALYTMVTRASKSQILVMP